MKVFCNGKETLLSPHTTLLHALQSWGYTTTPCAVAINENIIPVADYEHTELHEHDVVEILTPMAGG